MNLYEHVYTFVSLILGLGVANVLANFASLRKAGTAVRWYYLHVAWGALLLVLMALEWWIMLNWVSAQLTFFHFVFMLIKPSLLFFASAMLFPEAPQQGCDLRAYFYLNRRGIFLALAFYSLTDFGDSLLKGWEHFLGLGPVYMIANSTITLGAAAAAFSTSEHYHRAFFVVVVLLVGAAILSVPVAAGSIPLAQSP